jgi:Sir2- and TIR-associating SLOG family/SIR2-like domain
MEKKAFIERFSDYITGGSAALFIGAGMSMQAGYPSWKVLLKEIAEDLKLDLDEEHDLAGVAQFYLNKGSTGRMSIAEIIRREFPPKKDVPHTLRLLAHLPVRNVWTTNYDRLIETAWDLQGKTLDVKSRNDDFLVEDPWAHSTLFKMHGTVEHPTEIVLAKEDYELYRRNRSGFHQALARQLVSKHFLFLGFSFTDPNLFYVFTMNRDVFPEKPPGHHFAIVRRPPIDGSGKKAKARLNYLLNRHRLWVQDLTRYGITTLEVDSYDEISEVLSALESRVAQNSVLISGSCPEDYVGSERDLISEVAKKIGKALASKRLRLISGFGLTVGGASVAGVLEELYASGSTSLDKAMLLRPFPQTPPNGFTKKAFFRRYREDLLANAGIVIVIGGLKKKGRTLVAADGVLEEFEIARILKRKVIPIGATGGAAQEIWGRIDTHYGDFFDKMPRKEFDRLNDSSLSATALCDAANAVLKWCLDHPSTA